MSIKNRFRDVILSFYLYNEYRGYTQLYRLLGLLRKRRSHEVALISAVSRHADDERKHYLLFRDYFLHEKRMPFDVGRATGFFDILARTIVGKSTEQIGEEAMATDRKLFADLCRTIVVTEKRGLRQVDALLANRFFGEHPRLKQIFLVIRMDEPYHFEPYERWLNEAGERPAGHAEHFWEVFWHYVITLCVFPLYFFNPLARRRTAFPE